MIQTKPKSKTRRQHIKQITIAKHGHSWTGQLHKKPEGTTHY